MKVAIFFQHLKKDALLYFTRSLNKVNIFVKKVLSDLSTYHNGVCECGASSTQKQGVVGNGIKYLENKRLLNFDPSFSWLVTGAAVASTRTWLALLLHPLLDLLRGTWNHKIKRCPNFHSHLPNTRQCKFPSGRFRESHLQAPSGCQCEFQRETCTSEYYMCSAANQRLGCLLAPRMEGWRPPLSSWSAAAAASAFEGIFFLKPLMLHSCADKVH